MSIELEYWAKNLNEAQRERNFRQQNTLKSDVTKSSRASNHFSIFEEE